MELVFGIIVGALLLFTLAFLEVLIRKRKSKKTNAIGEQFADATEAEERLRSNGATGQSPMPDGKNGSTD
jgi:hypothetical protein